MKYIKAQTDSKIADLPTGKIRLHDKGEDYETPWIAIDKENNKCYLLNHALHFYPFPSWGMELPYSESDNVPSVDVSSIKGDSPANAVWTIHPEGFEGITEGKKLEEDGSYIFSFEESED